MPRFRKRPCKVKWVKTTTSVTGEPGSSEHQFFCEYCIIMPLFHQRIKPRSCRRPLIVGSLGKNGKKIDQWGGRQNRYEGLGLTTDRPQDAPGGPRQSLTGLGLRTD